MHGRPFAFSITIDLANSLHLFFSISGLLSVMFWHMSPAMQYGIFYLPS
jgi:hypothetical protein